MLTTVSETGIRSETDRCMTNGDASKEKDAHRQGHLEYGTTVPNFLQKETDIMDGSKLRRDEN